MARAGPRARTLGAAAGYDARVGGTRKVEEPPACRAHALSQEQGCCRAVATARERPTEDEPEDGLPLVHPVAHIRDRAARFRAASCFRREGRRREAEVAHGR